MSQIKISQLEQATTLNNPTQSLFVFANNTSSKTMSMSADDIARTLYLNHTPLVVGQGGLVLPHIVAQFTGTDSSYLQTNIVNTNSGGSGDMVITGDTGTDTNNFIDFGLNGSQFVPNPTVGTSFLPYDGYLYITGPGANNIGNLTIGSVTTGTRTNFISGGANKENIIAYIDAKGVHTNNNSLIVNNSTFSAQSAALIINGANNYARFPSGTDGYMAHITGKDGVAAKVIMDSYGTNTYSVFAGRSARGTAASPASTKSGDTLVRFSASSYGGLTGFQTTGVGRMDFIATEDHSDTARGSALEFYTTSNGSNTLVLTATMNGMVAYFPQTISANNLIVTNTINTLSNVQANVITANSGMIGSIVLDNNSIHSSNTAQDITFGSLAATANLIMNRTTVFNRNVTVNANVYIGNTVFNNGISTDSITLNDSGMFTYNVSAGNGTATQLTDKTTSVTCNGRTGQITTSNSSLAKGAAVTFTVNNSFITEVTDVPVIAFQSGATTNSYAATVTRVQPGYFNITITNNGTGALTDTIIINFAIIKVA